MQIDETRLSAAKASGGVSGSVIYDTVLTAAAAAEPAPATIHDFRFGTGQPLPLLASRLLMAELHAADTMERPRTLPAADPEPGQCRACRPQRHAIRATRSMQRP